MQPFVFNLDKIAWRFWSFRNGPDAIDWLDRILYTVVYIPCQRNGERKIEYWYHAQIKLEATSEKPPLPPPVLHGFRAPLRRVRNTGSSSKRTILVIPITPLGSDWSANALHHSLGSGSCSRTLREHRFCFRKLMIINPIVMREPEVSMSGRRQEIVIEKMRLRD